MILDLTTVRTKSATLGPLRGRSAPMISSGRFQEKSRPFPEPPSIHPAATFTDCMCAIKPFHKWLTCLPTTAPRRESAFGSDFHILWFRPAPKHKKKGHGVRGA